MLNPPTEMKAKCEIPLSKVKTLFPLTEAIKKKDQVTAQDIFQDEWVFAVVTFDIYSSAGVRGGGKSGIMVLPRVFWNHRGGQHSFLILVWEYKVLIPVH